MKGMKMKIAISVLCGAFALGGALCLSTDAQNVYAETPTLSQSIQFNEHYVVGTELTLPLAKIKQGNNIYDTQTVVRFPGGGVYTKSAITLNEPGQYTVEYRAITSSGELLVIEKTFQALNSFFQVSGVNSSAKYGVVDNAPTRPGVVASIAEGEKLLFHQVIDISDYQKSDILAEAFVAPIEQGLADALNVSFVLTDAYDSGNYVVITNKRLDRTPLEAVWQERSYVTANAVDQPMTGLEQNSGDFIWENEAYTLHQNDLYGTPIKEFYMAGIPNFDGTTIGEPTDIAMQSLRLSMDYAERRVYMNGKIVADLDDSSMFKQVQWKGFTTGECLLSVYASSYNQNSFNCVVTKWGTYEGEGLNQDLIVDAQAPTLTVDYGEYEETGYPNAVVGRTYPLPKIVAVDDTDREVSVKAKVYKDYNTPFQVSVKIKNGAFTPAYKGEYTVVYTATDKFGNSADLEYPIRAVVCNQPLTIALLDGESEGVAGNVVNLPVAEVQNAQGIFKLKVTARHSASGTEEEISLDGENAYFFRPLYQGEWKIVYEYSDYMETKTKEYTVTVACSQKPYIYEEANLPNYIIRGAAYPLPTVKGVYLETGEPVEATASVYIIDDAKPERLINATRFVSYAMEKTTIIYRMGTGANLAEKRYEIPVVDVGYDTFNLRIKDYFVAENFTIQADEKITLTTTETGTQSFSFISALQTFDFQMLFHVSNGRNKFDTINVYLTDSENANITVKASYIRNVSGNTIFKINDGEETYVSTADFIESNVENFRLLYKNDACTISPSIDYAVKVEKDINGAAFNGFPSGKVYLTMELDNIKGKAGVELLSINNQTMSAIGFDLVKPQISMSPVKGERIIDEEIIIGATYAADVLDPDTDFSMYVLTPSGNYAESKDGVVLDSLANPNRDYVIVAKEYGSYTVQYECEDASGNKTTYSYVFKVVDTTPPTVSLGKSQTEGKVGDTIAVAEINAQDNYTTCTTIIKVKGANGSFINLKKGGNSFVATMAGEYTVYYLVYDENYNLTTVSYTVTIR